jgi:predicted DNA binding CopG/RHH family protein
LRNEISKNKSDILGVRDSVEKALDSLRNEMHKNKLEIDLRDLETELEWLKKRVADEGLVVGHFRYKSVIDN